METLQHIRKWRWSLALLVALGMMLIMQPLTARAETITVTSTLDDGTGSLRAAIAAANPGDTIVFSSDMSIYLVSELSINKTLTIDGGSYAVKVSGDTDNDGTRNVRVFTIGESGVVALNHLNIVGAYGVAGGGIVNYGALTVQHSTLSNNGADRGGGICNYGAVTVQHSTLSSNWSNYGGGIWNNGTLTVLHSTLSGNGASYGGGIFSSDTVTVLHSTLSGNGAAEEGGGLWNSGTLNFANTLIANSNGGDCYQGGTLGSNTHNLVEDGTCSPALSGDPLLGPLADNGGDTLTHALLVGSQAIDYVPTTDPTCIAGVSIDQRGAVRADGVDRGGNACDIGAYEYSSIQTPTVILLRGLAARGFAPLLAGLLALGGAAAVKRKRRWQ
ncbi:MAG TPA: choice-of-anchor Q domain-containing protein [Anaerolineae bacterium]|nr:choice-of-anchor Q domain-containing protein [Anaerolineae bacterium]HQI83540.1 choice-of-anchor Q domain-containing protein [Anaerolineae bacterium]